ncbi:hypothetical protein BDY21DRAFT_347479 [Lineolata rhizophorae]|uniref:Gylcosyl hydrolase 115 C-terminal domain-containing protein n=1 Tax=Lineolata rhizophorae TaxID=578093 RepID=A0A6A6NYB4_9PEZI|nr:hypothetical protein BDY21DRAFT_347479 [Lineolata rhizophorae]
MGTGGGANASAAFGAPVIFNVSGIGSWEFGSGGRNASRGATVIAGTVGMSGLIDGLVEEGKLDVSAIEGEWEAFTSAVVEAPTDGVDRALVIAGSDKRGTIYGLYDVSEQIGVSPWYWWADVPSKSHDAIYAINTTKVQGSPSVKYRGFFLNDEAPALTGWINAKYPPSPYGPGYNADFYWTVFELLLRLRANYIWPAGADWGQTFFVDDMRNQPLADAMGIVIGTSHTEPMARATKEWQLFGEGPWQWNTNNESIIPFMKYGAERARPYENVITMGMRGSGDTALSATIQTEMLEDIVATQRDLLEEVHTEDITSIPQMWCLYKEVQGYFEAGMRVPDDVTLLWADDNWGNVRRLPVGNETERSGGAGVYFHFDYVGGPRDYKWVNTIQLQRTWEQMHLSYERNARTIWVVNVGDLKPLEIPISHFFDLAYDMSLWGPNSTTQWLDMWAAREFPEESAANISAIVNQFSYLAGRRKFELVEPGTYSVINYEEADNVLAEWDVLGDAARSVFNGLPSEYKPAFFEMVLHPVLGGGAVYGIQINSAKNLVYARQWRNSANTMITNMLDSFGVDHNLTVMYNDLLDGKWEHMMDQTHIGYLYWQQPMRHITPPVQFVQSLERALTGDMGVTTEGTNASVPGDDPYHDLSSNSLTMLPIDPYMATKRYFEVFNIGTNDITFNVSAEPHVILTQTTGALSPSDKDVKIYVDVDWDQAPEGSSETTINITSSTDYGAQFSMPSLVLPINYTVLPDDFTGGFVESDATISIEPAHYSRVSLGDSSSDPSPEYITIASYGRTLSGVTLFPVVLPDTLSTSSGPGLEYDFYSFTPTTDAVPANITVYLGTGLNTDPERPLKYAVGVDDGDVETVQYIIDQPAGQTPVDWEAAVADAAWVSTTNTTIAPGSHTLRLWALEPGVVFQKVVVDLGGVRESYLGPPESYRVG